jgi:hypothetical protein
VAKSRNNLRNPEAYYEHFLEMKAALKLARSDINDFPYKSAEDDNDVVDNTEFYAELFNIITSKKKEVYKSRSWWTTSIVKRLLDFQVQWETLNGENKPQTAEVIAEMKTTFSNKHAAEEASRKKKFEELDIERKGEKNSKKLFMSDMSSNFRDLVSTMKDVSGSGGTASSSSSVRNAMMGQEEAVSREEFNDLVKSTKKISSDIASILALLQAKN